MKSESGGHMKRFIREFKDRFRIACRDYHIMAQASKANRKAIKRNRR